jgi:outer membrane lipoprotein-sorting protein
MVWLAAVSLFAGSCGVKQTTRVPIAQQRPAKEAAQAELVAAYNRQASAVQSVNATLELNPVAGGNYSGVIEDYRDVRAFLLAKRPASIRMIGQAPVVAKNVFDMVSDGETFRIFIPPKNKFIVGATNLERKGKSAIENLRPQHLLDTVFWSELPATRTVLFEESDALPDHYYVLTLLREGGREIERKIWFDRSNLSVARIQIYGPHGRLDSDIRYSDWQDSALLSGTTAGGITFPRQILLLRPHEDYQLGIQVQKLTLNEEIGAERFRLEQPAGTELVRLSEGTGEKSP